MPDRMIRINLTGSAGSTFGPEQEYKLPLPCVGRGCYTGSGLEGGSNPASPWGFSNKIEISYTLVIIHRRSGAAYRHHVADLMFVAPSVRPLEHRPKRGLRIFGPKLNKEKFV